MADHKVALALAFVAAQPDFAARVLEQHPLEAVAEFLRDIPVDDHALLIQRMLPQYVGKLCRRLPDKEKTAVLSGVELSFAAAVLRYLPFNERNGMLSGFPAKRRAALGLLLSYAEDTVGAWLTPLVVTIPLDYCVEEALHQVRTTEEIVHSDHLFVVDRDRRLRGRVNYVELLRAGAKLPVQSLLHSPCHSLLGRMTLQKASEHSDWEVLDVMPVNNRNQQFIGVLRHVDLRKGLEHLKTGMTGGSGADPMAGIFEVYGDSLIALFQSLGDAIDSGQK